MKLAQARAFFLIIFIFMIACYISNAGVSIGTVGMLLVILFQYFMDRKNAPSLLPEKGILYPYAFFFLTLFIAALAVGGENPLKYTFKYLYYSLPLWIMYLGIIEKGDIKKVGFGWICASLTLSAAQVYAVWRAPTLRFADMFYYGNHNILAYVLLLDLPFLAAFAMYYRREKQEKLYGFALLSTGLCLLALLLSGSRGAMLAAIFSTGFLLLYLFFNPQSVDSDKRYCPGNIKNAVKIFACLSVALVLCFSFFTCGNAGIEGKLFGRSYDMERIYMWKSSLKMWLDHPVFGVGEGNWNEVYLGERYVLPTAKELYQKHPHNTFLMFLTNQGVVGGTGYLCFMLGTLFCLMRQMRKQPSNYFIKAMFWALIAINLHGLVDIGVGNKIAMRLYCTCLGFTAATLRLYRHGSQKTETKPDAGT